MEEEVTGGPAEVNDAAGDQNVSTDTGGTGTEESLNPAWNPLLEKLPSSLHPLATPVLRDWDKNFQNEIQKVHSQYEPYKGFVDQKVDPVQLQQAYELFNLMNTNPQLVYENMGQYYGFSQQEQGQTDQGNNTGQQESFDFNNPDVDITQHPKFQELMQNQQMLAQYLVSEQEQRANAAAQQQLDKEWSGITQKYPHLDELEVYQFATGGNMTLTQAAEQLNSRREAWLAESQRPAPKVFGGNGNGTPAAQQPDPTKLNSHDRRALVAQILAAQREG